MNGPSHPLSGGGESRKLSGNIIIKGFCLAVLLVACSTVCAEGGSYNAGASPGSLTNQWRTIDARMSPAQYRAASHHNRRLVLYTFEDTLVSLGMSEGKMAVASAVAGLAIGDPKIRLNNTMSLQLKDVTERDRSILLNFRLRW